MIGGRGCDKFTTCKVRPDLAFVLPDRVLVVEVDENSHENYEIDCELAKLDRTRWAAEYGNLPVSVIRFNPDIQSGSPLPLNKRLDHLEAMVRDELNRPLRGNLLGCRVLFLCYGISGNKHVEACRQARGQLTMVHDSRPL